MCARRDDNPLLALWVLHDDAWIATAGRPGRHGDRSDETVRHCANGYKRKKGPATGPLAILATDATLPYGLGLSYGKITTAGARVKRAPT
jgi:hypothetical protein